jgi:MFS family permease
MQGSLYTNFFLTSIGTCIGKLSTLFAWLHTAVHACNMQHATCMHPLACSVCCVHLLHSAQSYGQELSAGPELSLLVQLTSADDVSLHHIAVSCIGEVPAALLAGAAVDTIGRRITVGTGLLLTGLACCACSLLSPGWLTIALASADKACCSGTWTISYVYAAEIFPTYIRSVALAGTNQASRSGGVIAPGILYASEQMGLPAAAPFAALLAAALLGMLPETMGQPQPDSVADLDRLYGKQSSSSSGSSSTDTQQEGIWQQLKARCFAAGATDACCQDAAGRHECKRGRLPVGRQGPKLQRLLSWMSSSGSSSARGSSGWAIPAGWIRSSSSSGRGSSECGASWHAVSMEDDSVWQRQQQQQQAPSVPAADGDRLAEEALQSNAMEMGTVASGASL